MIKKNLLNNKKDYIRLPKIKRDGPLITGLFSITTMGFDNALDKKSASYFRLLCRLIDKSFDDYCSARNFIEKEIINNDKLAYHVVTVNKLEDCIFSVNRLLRILDYLKKEKGVYLLDLVEPDLYESLKNKQIKDVRNRIEHIDEDIRDNKINGGIFLGISEDYKKIFLNKRNCSFSELVEIIENYYKLMVGIIEKLPKSGCVDKYYDKDGNDWKLPTKKYNN